MRLYLLLKIYKTYIMKKFFTTLALIFVAAAAFASPVTESQARMLASRFFGGNGTAAAPELKLVRTGVQERAVAPTAVSAEPTYFVFNRAEGGFVIISGDNTVGPVLGYSLTNSFEPDNMSDGLKYWLDEVMSTDVAYARATKDPAFSSDIRPTAGTLVVAHQTAQWNQGSPYNGESPTIDGNKCITGCVATAAAIKARFHKWPYKGSGKSPAYTYYCEDAKHNVTIPANELGRVYDYDNMPLVYTGSATSAQNAAVAALMYDLGHVAQMMFGYKTGSGAYTSTLCSGMKTYMHYSKDAKYVGRDSNLSTWYAKLLKELQDVGPIIYDGHSPNSGGHCFIFDGMTDDNYVRVNWGWGGSNNALFMITESKFDFVNGQGAILNAIPDHSGIYTPDEIADATTVRYSKTLGTFSYSIKSGVDFKINYTFKTADGNTLQQKEMTAGNTVEFKTKDLEGSYILEGYVTGYPDVIYSCEFEF